MLSGAESKDRPLELPPHRLAALEAAVQHALVHRRYDRIHVLGHGEISCVLRWDGLACKRLPPFASLHGAESYRACVEEYLARLRQRGIKVLETRVQICQTGEGRFVAYCVQPQVPAAALALNLFRTAGLAEIEQRFDSIVAHISAVVDDALGLDGQVSNWAFVDAEPVYFDVTTPLMLGPDRRPMLDIEIFLASLPWIVRGGVRHFVAGGILARYHDRRAVLCDLLANLRKDGLDHLLVPLLARANKVLRRPLSLAEVGRYHRNDTRLFRWLQRLRRLESAVNAWFGRSSDGILLPPRTPDSAW